MDRISFSDFEMGIRSIYVTIQGHSSEWSYIVFREICFSRQIYYKRGEDIVDTVINIGLTVLGVLGTILLIMGIVLTSIMSIMFIKFYKFIKKQSKIFDIVGKLANITFRRK